MKHAAAALRRAGDFSATPLTPEQVEILLRYGDWLAEEASPAGGIGPDEADRIVDRHLADSLVFASGWRTAPATLIDVGSGVGLPGIPLAIASPGVAVTLLDRSQRRIDLARRATRVLELPNVQAILGDAVSQPGRYEVAVSRASLPPAVAMMAIAPILVPAGVAVIGLQRGGSPPSLPDPPPGATVELLETPDGVLDSVAWHLRMTVR